MRWILPAKFFIYGANTAGIFLLMVAYILAAQNPDFSITVTFNDFGEAGLELIVLSFAMWASMMIFILDLTGKNKNQIDQSENKIKEVIR